MSESYFCIRNIDGKRTNSLSFKVLENAGNGDCLFQSIMQFLEHDECHELPASVTDLRRKIVNYISHSSNWNRFVDTIIFNLENILPVLQETNYSERLKIKVYKHYMSQEYQFGTFAELQAASELFDFVYVVFREEKCRCKEETKDPSYNCYSSEDHKFKSKMFLLFSGHFRYMKPITSKNVFVVPQGDYKISEKFHASTDSIIVSVKKVTDSTRVCHLCEL